MTESISNKGSQYIFVGGTPRSGTTLVQNILDSHMEICGLPEMHYLEEIINLRKRLMYFVERKMVAIFNTREEIDEFISSQIQYLLNPLITKYNCKLLSEKTPRNVLVFSELLELFPGSRCIHVIRDPRATIASMFKVRDKAISENRFDVPMARIVTKSAIEYCEECMLAGLEAKKKFPQNVFVLKYEELIDNLEVKTKEICRFLKINWQENMMHPGSVNHFGEKGMTNDYMSVFYDKKSFRRNPDNKSIEKWKKDLKISDQIRISNYFKSTNQFLEFGYNFSIEHLPFIKRQIGLVESSLLQIKGTIKRNIYKNIQRLLN
ncbi:MAG: sulfotransferase [Proteobacteria bacterium]|nr:sulfotransferase [Pseudomonadota bacterium]